MKNLYEVITNLVNEKFVLKERANHLLLAMELGDVAASDEYDEVVAQIEQAESKLADIEKKYVINVNEMSKIISDTTGKRYVPKIFREVVHQNGKISYTYTFAACYVSEKSVYHFDSHDEILLVDAGYHKLLDDIDNRNGVIQFSGSEMFETEQLDLKEIYKNTNFIKMFTQPKTHTEVSKAFEKRVKPMLTKHLQSIQVANVDENLGREC